MAGGMFGGGKQLFFNIDMNVSGQKKLSSLGQKMDRLSKKAKTMSQALAAAGSQTDTFQKQSLGAGGVTGFRGPKQQTAMNDALREAQQMSMGADESMRRYQSTMDKAGNRVMQFSGSQSALNSNLGQSRVALAGFSENATTARNAAQSAAGGMRDHMQAAQNIQTPAQNASTMFDTIGQSAENTSQSVNNSSEQFGKMFGIGMNLMFVGMALSQVFGTMSKKMLKMTGASAAFGAAMKSVLLPFFMAITPLVTKLATAMIKLPRETKMAIGAFVALASVLGVVLFFGAQLGLLLISGLSLGMIATAAGVAAGALAILAAGFRTGMVIGRKFGDEVRFAMRVARTAMERFASQSIRLLEGVLGMLSSIVSFLLNAFTLQFDKALKNVEGFWKSFAKSVSAILKGLFLTDFVELLDKAAESALEGGKDIMQNIADGITDKAEQVTQAIKNALPDWVKEGLKMVGEGMQSTSSSIGSGFNQAANTIGVNDFILTDNGVLETHPKDTLIGTTNPEGLLNGGGGDTVNVEINDPVMKEEADIERLVDEVEDRVNRDTRGRTGGI